MVKLHSAEQVLLQVVVIAGDHVSRLQGSVNPFAAR